MDKGGRTKRIADEYAGLQKLGHSVLLVSFSEPPSWVLDTYAHSADWVVIPKGSAKLDWSLLRRLYREASRFNADVFHAHCEGSALYAGIVSKLLRRKCIGTVHRSDLRYYTAGWRHRVFYRFVDAFVAVSFERCEQMKRSLGIGSRPLKVIHWGVDARSIAASEDRQTARRDLGVTADPVLLSVGHLGEIKGHDDAIKAFVDVRKRLPGAHLYLAGDGSKEDYTRIRGLLETFELSDAVSLLGQVTDVQRWFSACDVFLLASREEAFGLVFIEAGLRRRPTIATRVGGIPEIIIDKETGLLVDPRSPDQITQAVLSLLTEEGRSAAMGEAAFARVTKEFSLQGKVADLAAYFSEVTTKDSG